MKNARLALGNAFGVLLRLRGYRVVIRGLATETSTAGAK